MKYLKLIEKLQKENDGFIVLIKNGIFFIAVGKDAVKLNKELGLKRTCMKNEVCKVGFQVKSIEKYISKMKEKDLAFQIYNYSRETEKEELIFKYEGNNKVKIENISLCDNCSKKEETEKEVLERLREYGKTN